MEKTTLINDMPFVESNKYFQAKHSRKTKRSFYKKTLRFMIGPLLGFWVAYLGHNFIHMPIALSMFIISALTIAGIITRYKYVKYGYLGLIMSINMYLVFALLR